MRVAGETEQRVCRFVKMRILRNKHHRKILQQYRILYSIVPKYRVRGVVPFRGGFAAVPLPLAVDNGRAVRAGAS